MTERSVQDAIDVDEVGIETGIFGGLRLRTAYLPVFRRSGDSLEIAAAQAATVACHDGREITLADMPMMPDASERQFFADLCQALHVGNHRNFDLSDCDLIVDHDLSRNHRLFGAVTEAACQAEAAGAEMLIPERIVCRLAAVPGDGTCDPALAVAQLRQAGFRIAADLFGGFAAGLRPEIAEVSGEWTARIAREPAAGNLLRQLVERQQAQGTRVLVGGIATPGELDLALDVGADYLAGDLLARQQLAGTIVDQRPRLIADLRPVPGKAAPISPDGATIVPFGRPSAM